MTTQLSRPYLYISPDLGRVFIPDAFKRLISYPGQATKSAINLREIGVVEAVHKRPVMRNGQRIFEIGMVSITHNERVDAGAQQQAVQVFGGGGTPAAPSATVYPKVIAIANGTLTKAKTDLSLGSATTGVTTNEFTTIGLSRVAATTPVGGDYTVPASLGAVFSQVVKKTFTASGSGTAVGSGVFDSATVAGSILYVEDNFSSSAVMVTSDTLAVTWTISN